MPGSRRALPRGFFPPNMIRNITKKSTTCSMSGSIQARPTPSLWMIPNTSRPLRASIGCATAAVMKSCIWKAPTSIAAGSILRCLESCGTRGRAPYDAVLTHGFVLDEKGQKMSKSLGNVVAPQTVIKDAGADILRLWVAASDYSDDLRIGPEILKTFVETYRKLRNTIRWMLGSLGHYDPATTVSI